MNQPSNADPDATPTVTNGERTGAVFATTHWSVVLAAGQSGDTAAGPALEALCRAYWYPVYAFLRRDGHAAPDAEDLTQEFFARLLARNYLAQLRPAKGKFRSFLLASLKHFLANEWKRSHRLKRGGGQVLISLDTSNAENRYAAEPSHDVTAGKIFERRWALTLLEKALARLREEWSAKDRSQLFDWLKKTLTGEETESTYAQISTRLGMSEAAVRMAALRLRRRYREILREEIARTVDKATEIDDELRHLFAALR